MKARMKNPALVLEMNPAIQAMMGPIYRSGISTEFLECVGLRVGQLNNCELCIDQSFIRAEKNSTTKDRIDQVSDWRSSTQFNEAEQVALEAAEAITLLKDKYNSVPDSLWSKIEMHYDEKRRAALIMFIAVMNLFTRVNVATRQLTADWE